MDVVIAGGHGQIALHLERLLTERGDSARGLIRNPDHAADLERVGAVPVVCDLEAETDLRRFVEGADAIVFAAGAGPGSGPERKRTVDLGARGQAHGRGRVALRDRQLDRRGRSRLGARVDARLPGGQGRGRRDARAERAGLHDRAARPADRRRTRPATWPPGPDVERGDIPRADVALVLLAALDTASTVGKTFNVVSGDEPVDRADRRPCDHHARRPARADGPGARA